MPEPRRGGVLKGLLYTLGFLVVMVGAAAAYLVLNPPSDFIRQTLTEQVKAKTGRDLVVAGPASFTFYPGVGVSLKDVSLSGPPGAPGKLVSMEQLNISVKAMPLIAREIAIDTLILKKPVFDLRVDKAGRRNWDFAQRAAALETEGVRFAQAKPATATDAVPAPAPADTPVAQAPARPLPAKLAELKNLQLDDVRIENGTLRYTDERNGQSQQVDAVNVALSLQSLQSPLTAKGTLGWKGETTSFDAKLTNVKTLLEEQPAKLAFTASNTHINTSYDGKLLVKDGADLEGQLTAKSASARNLGAWLGTTLPPVAGFGPLSVAGLVKTNGNVTSLSNATFGLDGATATGNVMVTTGGVRPAVQANLKLSELNLNKYLTSAAGGVMATDKAPAAAAPAPVPAPAPAQKPAKPGQDAIENLLNTPQPAPGSKVYGAVQRAGWASEALNLALLGVADVDAKLQVGRLLFQNIKVGQSALTVGLKNRVLKTTFDEVQLYDGRGKGFLTVDGTGSAANIGANFGLESISAQPFLKDAANFDWLAGKAKVGLQLAATGASQLQLVESLNGKADVKLNDGAIVGFNLAGAIRNITQGKFTGLKKAPAEKTDFSEMGATFAIANGVATNQDLSLVSPLLRVTGAGTISLPPRTVDYTVKPKLVASLEGQGQQTATGAALSGLEVPVRITGSWDKPAIEPDLKGVLSNPDKAIEAVKEIGKKLKGKDAGQIVDELVGKDSDTGKSAKQLLNKFLKPQ